jgi:hypothetical protein
MHKAAQSLAPGAKVIGENLADEYPDNCALAECVRGDKDDQAGQQQFAAGPGVKGTPLNFTIAASQVSWPGYGYGKSFDNTIIDGEKTLDFCALSYGE